MGVFSLSGAQRPRTSYTGSFSTTSLNTYVTALSVTGKAGKLTQLGCNNGTGNYTQVRVTIDGTVYTIQGNIYSYSYLNSLGTAYSGSGTYGINCHLSFKNSMLIEIEVTSASTGNVYYAYETE